MPSDPARPSGGTSAQAYLTLLESVPGMVFRCRNDAQWTMQLVSSGSIELTGYAPADLIDNQSIAYSELIHPDDRQDVWQSIQLALDSRQDYVITYRIRTATGAEKMVWEQGRGVFDPDGELVCIEGFITDITEIEETRRAFRLTRQKLDVLLDSFEDLVFTLDNELQYTGVYGRWLQNTSIKAGDLVGKTIGEVLGQPGSEAHRDAARKALTGEQVMYDWRSSPETGGRSFQTSLSPMRDLQGGIIGLLGVSRDITARLQSEEQNRRYAILFEASRDILLVLRKDNGAILAANPAAVEALGYSQEALLQRYWQEIESRETAELDRFSGEAFRAGLVFETRLQPASGSTIPVEASARGTVLEGEEVLLCILRDISERKAFEDQLIASQQLTESIANSLPTLICVLDQQGTIVAVNQPWKDFAEANGLTEAQAVGIGANYLEVCLVAAAQGNADAQAAQEGIQAVLQGVKKHYEQVYRADSPSEQRWFQMVVTPLTGGHPGVVITHTNITADMIHQREQEAVIELSMALRTAFSLEEVLPVIVREIMHLLDCTSVALCRWSASSQQMVVEGAGGDWASHQGARFEAGAGSLSQEVLDRREQMVFNQTASLIDWRLPPFIDVRDEHVFCIPRSVVETSDWIFWVQKSTPFLPREVQLLASFADVASVAIHRATLYDQTRQQLQHIRSLRQVDLAILENKDVQASMQVIVEIARDQLPVEAVAVYLQPHNQPDLRLAAAIGFDPQPGQDLRWQQTALRSPCPCKPQNGVMVHVLDRHADFLEARGLEPSGFKSYVALPIEWDGSQKGLLEVFAREPLYLKSGEADYLQALRGQAAIAMENAQLLLNLSESNRQLLQSYDSTIEGWSSTLALRDEETQEHTLRVMRISLLLAETLGVPEEELKFLRWGALLHDIGKMGIPDSILLKPGPLTDEERLVMEKHPVYAYECLRKIEFLDQALAIPFCHHEHWDGSGYPQGLVGKTIPLPARIFAVADVWDALRTDRPYRQAWTDAQALAYIQSESGQHFDPEIVQTFLDLLEAGQLEGL